MDYFYENLLAIDCNWCFCFLPFTCPLVSCLDTNLWRHDFRWYDIYI